MKLLIMLLLLVLVLSAQSPPTHIATLQWTDAINPPGTLYNVYRATGLCSGTPAFTRIASMIGGLNYQDKTITTGTYCYAVTAASNNGESPQSNTAQAVLVSAPTGLTVVVQ